MTDTIKKDIITEGLENFNKLGIKKLKLTNRLKHTYSVAKVLLIKSLEDINEKITKLELEIVNNIRKKQEAIEKNERNDKITEEELLFIVHIWARLGKVKIK